MYFKDAIPFNEPYETSGHLEAATISFIDLSVSPPPHPLDPSQYTTEAALDH